MTDNYNHLDDTNPLIFEENNETIFLSRLRDLYEEAITFPDCKWDVSPELISAETKKRRVTYTAYVAHQIMLYLPVSGLSYQSYKYILQQEITHQMDSIILNKDDISNKNISLRFVDAINLYLLVPQDNLPMEYRGT